MRRRVYVKLTFASLPTMKMSSKSIATSAVLTAALVGMATLIGTKFVHRNIVLAKKYEAVTLYAPSPIHLPPPHIKVKPPVPPPPTVVSEAEGRRIELPKLGPARLKIEARSTDTALEPKPVVLVSSTSVPLFHTSSDNPHVTLAPQAKAALAAPTAQAGQSVPHGSTEGQNAHNARVVSAGWPGASGQGNGRGQGINSSNYHPIEVLAGPRPEYTPEAKDLHIQGSVVLRVLVSASGKITVLDIIKGLGHGLDETARRAAVQYRVRPASRDGLPVDQVTTITVRFELG
jgi:TonB family protein